MKLLLYTPGQNQEQRVVEAISGLRPGIYGIEAHKIHEKVSMSQRRYYFGVVVMTVGLYIGETKQETHEFLKKKFNPKIIKTPRGETEVVGGSTSDFNTKQMSEYIERIRNWAMTSEGVYIPEPNEVTWEMEKQLEHEYSTMIFGHG